MSKNMNLKDIAVVAKTAGIPEEHLSRYGDYKAKISLDLLEELKKEKDGKLILVSAITPTPAGEGKTTTSIGLHDALRKSGHKSVLALREPSLGPVFGMKGGATGGGKAQVAPMEDINLHFTGDIPAVERSHNLIAAAVDNEIHWGRLNLDSRSIRWKRAMDMNDRSLREIVISLGGTKNGYPRETGFDITAASEIMAILCLSESYNELKERIEKILIGLDVLGNPVFAKDLGVAGAATALLKDALCPNIVQTLENNPVLIHGGPFANIAQGANSIIATRLALKLGDYAITEAGFAFELGAEKFFDIVARKAGFSVSAVVLVATVRALKYHGGADLKKISEKNIDALRKGFSNLEKHYENILQFGTNAIVAVNRFSSDSPDEEKALSELLAEKGIPFAWSNGWEKGGAGALDLAEKVVSITSANNVKSHPLYSLDIPVEEKILTIAGKIYGAKKVDYHPKAHKDIELIRRLGLEKLPVCIAKTQNSLSDNPKLLGRPKDFLVTVREIEIASGAGFLIPITGDIMRMPGLPQNPAYKKIDIDSKGNISGIS
ncbi:MAG TPA: formate--tetrahydrofolate ligase [Lentisphaeria bacterium]|nr:MAG: formate--tetrahydrofolate ligase [Lentisphaerae bacterium GWF2_49_21]HBC88205.1 formate--tetrahydrofolate ligase [Lentisphaeria bacterium]